MEPTDLIPMLENLSESMENLEDVLSPLLSSSHAEIASKLPLLDKAKLHVLTAYAIESVLFSALRLSGVDARDHPVYRELTRVKQYFAKIEDAEKGGSKKRENLSLNKDAASRILKHALAGNDKYDRRIPGKQLEAKPNTHIRFQDMSEQVGTTQRFQQFSQQKEADAESSSSSSSSSSGETIKDVMKRGESISTQPTVSKKRRLNANTSSAAPIPTDMSTTPRGHKEAEVEKRPNGTPNDTAKKHKPTQPPKSTSQIFQDLLKKQSIGTGYRDKI